MATAARDRSARSRIREFLVQHGPLEDPSGGATALLKDAVGYRGNDVAFIQLVTAMDKGAEISREIRGKRTYKISATAPAAVPVPRGAAPVAGVPAAPVVIDYQELARAVVQELARVLAGRGAAEPAGGLDAVRAERDRLQAERDDYAKRLQIARRQLSALLAQSADDGIAEEPAAGVAQPGQVQQAS